MHRRNFPRTVYHPKIVGGVVVRNDADCVSLENNVGRDGWVDSPDQLPAKQVALQAPPPRSVHQVMATERCNEAVARAIVNQEARRFAAAQATTTLVAATHGPTTVVVNAEAEPGPVLRVDSERQPETDAALAIAAAVPEPVTDTAGMATVIPERFRKRGRR